MAPTLRKRRRLSEKPPSIGWFDLPFEMREMIIDEMDPITRCKFAECSKLCEEEVKGSKNYLYGIALVDIDEEIEREDWEDWEDSEDSEESKEPEEPENMEVLQLSLSFDPFENIRDCWFEFISARHNLTIVAYRCHSSWYGMGPPVKWTKIETGKPKDVRMRYLNKYLQKYKHCIRSFSHEDKEPLFHGFNIENLKRLESFYIKNEAAECQKLLENEVISMNQFLQLEKLYTYSVYFTYQQFTEFNGYLAWFKCDEFNEETIKKYLKMRKNGEIHEDLENLKIRGIDKYVNVENVCKEVNGFNYKKGFCWYKFSFHSNVDKNGQFNVEFSIMDNVSLSVEWKDAEISI